MATAKIKPRRSALPNTPPTTANIEQYEIAMNTADKKLYTRDGSDNIITIGAGNLSGLGDVAVSTPAAGQLLIYNSGTSKWANGSTISTAVSITDSTASTSSTTGALKVTGGVGVGGALNVSGNIATNGNLVSNFSSGDEGGEIQLAKPQTNTTLSGTGVTIDVYQNKLRIFENGGTTRGVYVDLTAAGAGVGTNLISASSSGDVVGPASSTDNALARFDGTTGKLIQNSTATLSDTGALDVANVTSDYVQLDTTAGAASAVGRITWDAGEGTAVVGLTGGNVNLPIGRSNTVIVYNGSGATIPKGSVVAVNGAQGQRPSVVLADADSEPLSAATLGVAAEAIANGAEGIVSTFGIVSGVDTSAFTAGNHIYLSQTAGSLTATRPSAPAHTVFIGWVLHVNASSGRIFININNGWELDELHNVNISSVANNNLLQYDSANAYWKNVAPSAVTGVGSAAQLVTGRTISLTGDVTYTSGSFDGTANVTGTATLANSGVTAGTYQSVTVDAKGRVTAGTNPTTLSGFGITDAQPLDADLTAIAGLTGTSGFLKKTAADTWSLDTNTYLTGNQNITLSGDITGSGTTAITTTLANSGVTIGTYRSVTVDAKGRVTAGTNPTTLSGYGITDAQPLDADLTAIAALAGTSGFLKKTAADTWTLDTSTYLTSYTETDTLATVTGRGATTATAVSFTNSTASSSTSNGAVVVTGGVGIGGALNVGGNLTVTGNLTINGTTTTVNSTTVTVDDPIFTLGGDTAPSSNDNKDRGIEFRWHNGTAAKVGFFGFDTSTGYLTFIPDATNTSEVFSGTSGDIQATNFRGALVGNADTATKLATARTINGVSFDGSANITVTTAGTGISVSGTTVTNTGVLSVNGNTGTITGIANASDTHYIGTTAVTLNRASANLALTGISSVTLPGSTSGSVQIIPTASAGTGTVLTLPATTGTVVTTGDTGTVTNTMLAGSIANTKLANSTISGISLGSNLNTLTIGTGLSGTSYNGSSAVTITNTGVLSVNGNTGTITGIANASDTHYIGTTAVTLNRASANLALTGISSVTLPGSTSGSVQIVPTAAAGSGTVLTLPATTGTVVTTGDTGTVTNTMLAGSIATSKITGLAASATTDTTNAANISSGTLPLARLSGITTTQLSGTAGITNAQLANSSITVNGTAISLGSNATIKASTTNVLTIGTGLGGVSFDGSSAVTITNTGVTSAVAGTDTSVSSATGAVTISNTSTLATVTGRGATTATAISLTNSTASSSTSTGALVVTGGVGIGGAVNVGGAIAVTGNITISGVFRDATSGGTVISDQNVAQTTVATTATTAIDTWAIATYRSAKYVVQITQGTNYQVSEILVLHNGTTTTMTEYAVLETSGALATITSDISSTNARLLVTMGSATSATINIQRVLMVV